MRVFYSGKKATLHTTLGKIVPGINEVPDNALVRELIAKRFFSIPMEVEPLKGNILKVLDEAENKMYTNEDAETKEEEDSFSVMEE